MIYGRPLKNKIQRGGVLAKTTDILKLFLFSLQVELMQSFTKARLLTQKYPQAHKEYPLVVQTPEKTSAFVGQR